MVRSIACQLSAISKKNEQVLSFKSITTTSSGTKVITNDETPSQMVYAPLTLQPLPPQQSAIVTNTIYCNSGMILSNCHII